jgi:hypothetical protein
MKLKIWKLLTVNVGIGKQWEISFLQVHYKVFVMLTVLQNQLLPQFHLFLSSIPHWLQCEIWWVVVEIRKREICHLLSSLPFPCNLLHSQQQRDHGKPLHGGVVGQTDVVHPVVR